MLLLSPRIGAERLVGRPRPLAPQSPAHEHALLRARREQATSTVRFRHDPAALLSAFAAGELPDFPEIDECLVIVDASTAMDHAREPAWA